MENLFHGKEMTKIYDLKGSTRNRFVKGTGKMNEVSFVGVATLLKILFSHSYRYLTFDFTFPTPSGLAR